MAGKKSEQAGEPNTQWGDVVEQPVMPSSQSSLEERVARLERIAKRHGHMAEEDLTEGA